MKVVSHTGHTTFTTRNRAIEIARNAEQKGSDVIELTDVAFISRAFADEIVKQADQRNLELIGSNNDVRKMIAIAKGDS